MKALFLLIAACSVLAFSGCGESYAVVKKFPSKGPAFLVRDNGDRIDSHSIQSACNRAGMYVDKIYRINKYSAVVTCQGKQ